MYELNIVFNSENAHDGVSVFRNLSTIKPLLIVCCGHCWLARLYTTQNNPRFLKE